MSNKKNDEQYFVAMRFGDSPQKFYKDYPEWKHRHDDRTDWWIDASVQNERDRMSNDDSIPDRKEIHHDDIYNASSICDVEYHGGKEVIQELEYLITSINGRLDNFSKEVKKGKKKREMDPNEARAQRCRKSLALVFLKLLKSPNLIFDKDRRQHYLDIARRLDELIHEF